MNNKHTFRLWTVLILLLTFILRLIALISNTITFHADEALVGLMARHINQGLPIPAFFYGRPYLGSLDPLLAAGAFRLFGESVVSLRLPQVILSVAITGAVIALALRLTRDHRIALMAGLLLAIPPVNTLLYTLTSLGGHAEILLIGLLTLLVGYDIYCDNITSLWRWFVLGALIGLGWWTYNLIVVYALPVGVFLLLRWRQLSWKMIGVAGIGFLIFSAPWWVYNIQHNWESVQFLVTGYQPSGGGRPIGIGDKTLGLLLFGLPAVMGIRFPWEVGLWTGWWAIPVVLVYAMILVPSLVYSLRTARRVGAEQFLWVMALGYIVIFVASSFGIDATGRYLLPLAAVLAVLIAIQAQRLSLRYRWIVLIIPFLMAVNLVGIVVAMRTVPPGITPQFDPVTDIPEGHDQAAIDFLLARGGQYGYSTFWAAYRLIFLSGEKVVLSPQLPYKISLTFTEADRYPAYTAAVEQAERPVLVTAMLPELDQIIAQRLEANNITYQRQVIGPYTIFYDLSRRVNPVELGLQSLTP